MEENKQLQFITRKLLNLDSSREPYFITKEFAEKNIETLKKQLVSSVVYLDTEFTDFRKAAGVVKDLRLVGNDEKSWLEFDFVTINTECGRLLNELCDNDVRLQFRLLGHIQYEEDTKIVESVYIQGISCLLS